MKFASICIRAANSKHKSAGTQLKTPSEYANAHPIKTGAAAPLKVLGLAYSLLTHPFRLLALSCHPTVEGRTETPVDFLRSEAKLELDFLLPDESRSEERRVGKEC